MNLLMKKMDKRGQFDPKIIAGILAVIVFIAFISSLNQVIQSTSCQNEKSEINRLNGLLSSCQSSNNELLNSLNVCLNKLNNCQNALNESNESCNKIIQNLTNQYELKFQKNEITLYFQKKFRIFLLFLSIPLTLFSIGIKFDKNQEKILFILKLIMWIIYIVITFVMYQDFFRNFFSP